MRDALCKAVTDYENAMKAKDYHAALSAADSIRNIGLQLGSDAWNTAMDRNLKGAKP